jgi:heme/copper-type cytochrome/quinol oxidase subunit 4
MVEQFIGYVLNIILTLPLWVLIIFMFKRFYDEMEDK